MPTPEQLRALLRYDPETGKLFWKARGIPKWDGRYAGKEAFTATSGGYKVGRIYDVLYRAHRVIWAIQTGAWPAHTVDHINRDRADNRWANLRDVPHHLNCKNWPLSPRNNSGYLGVKRHGNRWRAQIHVKGKSIHLGLFVHLEDAASARAMAEAKYGFIGG